MHDRATALAESLAQRTGHHWSVRWEGSVPTTMTIAQELAAQVGPDASGLVLADEQTAGRGRQGRTWSQPAIGFCGTFIFPLSRQLPEHIIGFPLIAGMVLCNTLGEFGCAVKVKWPNDIVSGVERLKVSGVLCELIVGSRGFHLLVGIGINLAGESIAGSTSVQRLCGRTVAVGELAVLLGPRLVEALHALVRGGMGDAVEKFATYDALRGEHVRVELGAEVVSGVAQGIHASGGLRVQTDEGERVLMSGHILSIGAAKNG